MLRSLARLCALVFAVFGLMPGGSELVEQLMERVAHGHVPHSVAGESDPYCAEQGCTPCSGPTCECHRAAPIVLSGRGAGQAAHEWWTAQFDAAPWTVKHKRVLTGPPPVEAPANLATAPPTPPPNASV